MRYEVEVAETIIVRLAVEANSPEEARQKAQAVRRYEYESIERRPDDIRILQMDEQ